MITFIVKGRIKPGQRDELGEALRSTAAFISAREPDFATYAYLRDDSDEVTFVNLASDSQAMADHFANAPDNPAGPPMMASLEVLSVEILGELSPEVEAIVTAMSPKRSVPTIGTFDRKVAVRA